MRERDEPLRGAFGAAAPLPRRRPARPCRRVRGRPARAASSPGNRPASFPETFRGGDVPARQPAHVIGEGGRHPLRRAVGRRRLIGGGHFAQEPGGPTRRAGCGDGSNGSATRARPRGTARAASAARGQSRSRAPGPAPRRLPSAARPPRRTPRRSSSCHGKSIRRCTTCTGPRCLPSETRCAGCRAGAPRSPHARRNRSTSSAPSIRKFRLLKYASDAGAYRQEQHALLGRCQRVDVGDLVRPHRRRRLRQAGRGPGRGGRDGMAGDQCFERRDVGLRDAPDGVRVGRPG